MATITIENGKRVEELLEVNNISSDSFFLVSEKSLSRKITLVNLRSMFSGDDSTTDLNNKYYTVEYLNKKFQSINEEINKLNQKIINIGDIYTSITNDFEVFKKYVNDQFTSVNSRIDNVENIANTITNRFNEFINNTWNPYKQIIDGHSTKIQNLEGRIKTLEDLLSDYHQYYISYGPDVPQALDDGHIYLQYF